MIKSFIAATQEVDDPKAAVSEIWAKLEPEKNLLKYSLGIISCFSEFEETGTLLAICNSLPFDCIGATTCLCAADAMVDQVLFTITVLTSDDCSFECFSIPVNDNVEQSLSENLQPQFDQDEKPALIFSYFPLINEISGDRMISAIDRVTGGVPLFGTTAVDHTLDYSTAQTIYNGKAYRQNIILGAIYGQPNITFRVASINEKKLRSQKALITASDGNILIGVNGKPALKYLEEVGIAKEELESGVGVIPIAVDYANGPTVTRSIFTVTPEGYAVCGGTMPVNATISIGHFDIDDVLHLTQDILNLLQMNNGTLLGYSCIARFFSLGANEVVEAETILQSTATQQVQFAYSGGEICPIPDENGILRNFFHNYTVAFCRLS